MSELGRPLDSTSQSGVTQGQGSGVGGSSIPTQITVADTTDSTCFVALFESATGDLAPKTDGGLLYNASTGALTPTILSMAGATEAQFRATTQRIYSSAASKLDLDAATNINFRINGTTVASFGVGELVFVDNTVFGWGNGAVAFLGDSSAGTLFINATTLTISAPQINDTSSTHQYVMAVNELTADRTITLPLLTGNDTFVFADHIQTLTNKVMTTIEIGHASDTTLARASAGDLSVEGNRIFRVGGADVPVADGGTGVSAITALSIWVANSANTITEVTPGAGNSVRINAGGTAWEAYTPGAGGGTPGGSDTQLQYNNAGAFGGVTAATWAGGVLTFTTPVLADAANSAVLIVEGTGGTPIYSLKAKNADSGGNPALAVVASLATIGLDLQGTVSGTAVTGLRVSPSASLTPTAIEIIGGASGVAPQIKAYGGGTNFNVNLVSDGTAFPQADGVDLVTISGTQTLTNKTLTLPQINDTSADHQYVFAVSELTADRTVTLPLLTGADTFVFESHTQTLSNKTFAATCLVTPANEATDTTCFPLFTTAATGAVAVKTKATDLFFDSSSGLLTVRGLTIGIAGVGVDYALTFNGETTDGVLTWMEDEDYFSFADDVMIGFGTSETLYFRDTGLFIHSSVDGQLEIEADTLLVLGVAGTTEFGDGTLRLVRPNTDYKIDLGDTTHRFNDAWFARLLTDTTTGLQILSGTTQKVAFYGSTPVVQPAGTTDVLASLVTLGLRAASSNPPLDLGTGQVTCGPVAASTTILSSGATSGIGYTTGAGGAVTQLTNKATATPAINKMCGKVTMNNAALAAATIVSHVLTNSAIVATDVLVVNHISGGTVGAYTLNAQCAAGSATINVRNNTAGSLSEAIVYRFAVIRGADA